MPAQYCIDAKHNLVVSTCLGELYFVDMLAHQSQLRADPAFKSSMNQLLDFGAVTAYSITSKNIRQLAEATLFSATSRRAFVVDERDVYFGLARMYEIMRDKGPEQIQVFRSYAQAREWLGLPADYPRPVTPI